MAAAKRGFDFLFVEPLSERLTCVICHLAFREPTLTECGHQFCRSCLERCLQRSASCPECRTLLESPNRSTFPNLPLKREILDLKIKCPLHEKGCEWTSELRNGKMHDSKCQYVDVSCANGCQQLVMRKDRYNHERNECPQRNVFCEHCNQSMKQVEMQAHYTSCDKYPIACTYKCGFIIKRCQMDDHIGRQGTCPNSTLDCDFKDSGCKFKGNRHHLNQHIESNVALHLGLIATALKIATQKLSDNELVLNSTREELSATRVELARAKDELIETRVQLSEEIHRRSLSLSPETPKQFLFTWTIDNWNEKMTASTETNDKVFNSSQFYVYPGYHMCIGVYPNSYHADARGFLGVALFANNGQFDGRVRWPFPFSFQFEIVSHQVGVKNICCMRSPPYKDALQSPTCPTGSGFPKFASHEDLESDCYMKDDSICIKLCVHVKDEGV